MILAEKNDVVVVEEKDEHDLPVYIVSFRDVSKCRTSNKGEAMENFSILQPLKAVCSKCKSMDVIVFFGRLGVGRLQVPGEGGWRMERFFGGVWDHRDVTLCPECALALDAEMNAYLARKQRK